MLSKANIASLWISLSEIYHNRFLSKYGIEDTGTWFEALKDLHMDLLDFGLSAMMRDVRFETWPPNCTQFRHLCLAKPVSASFPSVHDAYREARENLWHKGEVRSWSHPAIKFTIKQVTIPVVTDDRQHIAYPAFRMCYELVCKRISEGGLVPVVTAEELVMPCTRVKPSEEFTQLLQKLRQSHPMIRKPKKCAVLL